MVSFSDLRKKWGLAMPFDRASDEVLPLKYRRVLHESLCAEVPEVDAFENAREVVVIVHAPGVKREHLQLKVMEGGMKLVLDKNPKKEGFQPEFVRQNYVPPVVRYVDFPAPVDPSGAKAVFKNGVLELTVPKKAQ
ncbi:MAG: Hsp20/alpha crystallin family protein [Candidatus Micrarchaeota archaeon]